MKIEYSKRFIKDFRNSPKYIRNKFKLCLEIFIEDKNNRLLNNHPLVGRLSSYRSINITGDWRAIFEELNDNIEITAYFIAIGTHSQLYN